jgi:hypothetical protein
VSDPDGETLAWPTVVDLLLHTDRSIVRSVRTEERKTILATHCPRAA